MTEPTVRGKTLAEWLAGAPKRSSFVRPDRLDRKVYDRHTKYGAGYPLHDYDSAGRCTVEGCNVSDPSEGDPLAVSE